MILVAYIFKFSAKIFVFLSTLPLIKKGQYYTQQNPRSLLWQYCRNISPLTMGKTKNLLNHSCSILKSKDKFYQGVENLTSFRRDCDNIILPQSSAFTRVGTLTSFRRDCDYSFCVCYLLFWVGTLTSFRRGCNYPTCFR